ncbi:transposase [Streptomyces collinus]|uniref:transposase n=1 Tax=Streptomyces collinus TaxID=42684 RepID=UPI00341A4EBF
MAWKYRTNSPWRDLPDELGSFQTAHKRLIRWAVDGTWEMILAAVLAATDADDDLDWTVSVDSTVVQAHQHAAGARKTGGGPLRRARRSRARTLPRRAVYQDPPGRRRPRTAPGLHPHRRPGR